MKTTTNAALLLLSLPLLSMFGAGCAAYGTDDAAATTSSSAATAGLTIAEQRADFVRGSFERDGAKVSFELSVSSGVHRSKVWDASGPVMESTLSNDYEDTTYLGGKARVHGRLSDAEPTIEGDPDVWAKLNDHPTARLFFDLRFALHEANVPRELFAASRDVGGADGVRLSYLHRGSFYLAGRENLVVTTTWQAWVFTLFTFWGSSSAASVGCAQALTGWSAPVCSWPLKINEGPWRTGARYYGYHVRIANNAAAMNGQIPLMRVEIEEL